MDDGGHISRASHFQLFFINETSLSCRVSHQDTPLLGGLDVGFEVATDSIANRHIREIARVKEVAMKSRQLQEFICEPVIVLLLLHGVVESRVTKVLLAVRNQETFELIS